jgi:hypothetical protein
VEIERAKDNFETLSMINRYKTEIAGVAQAERNRREAEKKWYLDGLKTARITKEILEDI